jgi:hypothetical protein
VNNTPYLKGACQNCGNNIEFPEAGLGSTVECPHCGQRTALVLPGGPGRFLRKMPGLRLPILIGGAVVLAAMGFWYFLPPREKPEVRVASDRSDKEAAHSPGKAAAQEPGEAGLKRNKSPADLKAGEIGLEITKGSSLIYAVGAITNDSDFQRFGVKVTLNLIDQKGAKVGTTRDYIGILEPHQAWQFRALITDPKAVTAALDSIKEED